MVETIAFDQDGEPQLRRRIPTPRESYQALLDTIDVLVKDLEHELLGETCSVGAGPPASGAWLAVCRTSKNFEA